MQSDKSIFKDINFHNKKCESFLDVMNIDQIKGKMDCLKFLSTPYAFDAMLLKEQDFYHNKREETYEKVFNLSQINKFVIHKSNKKLSGLNYDSKKVLKNSMKNNIKMNSSSLIKLLDDKNLKEYFVKNGKKENGITLNHIKYPDKSAVDIVYYFKTLSEDGISFEDVKKRIKNFYKNYNENKTETSYQTEKDNKKKNIINNFSRTYENLKTQKLDIKKLNFFKEFNSNLQEESQIDSKREKLNDNKNNFKNNISLYSNRESSSDNKISNFFFTNPNEMTLNRKSSIKTMKSNNYRKNIKQKHYSVISPVKKLMKNKSKEYLNEIFANTQIKEEYLLNDSDIEDFCKTGMEREKFEEKDFEKFLKLKKLENETNQVKASSIEKINENLRDIYSFIQTKNKKSKFKIGQSHLKTNKNYSINYKKNKNKIINQEKDAEKIKNLLEKNSNKLDKKDVYKMIDYCHSKSKIDRNIMFNSFKEYYKKNAKVEGVKTKLKGNYNTPADEYIKDTTLQEFKKKGLFLYGDKQGYYNKHYVKIYGIEKDVMRMLNSIK